MASGRPPLYRHTRQRRAASSTAGGGPAGVHRGGGEEAPGRPGEAPAARQVQVQRPGLLRCWRGQAAARQVPQLPVVPGGGQEGCSDNEARGGRRRPPLRRPLAGYQDHTDQGQGPARQQQRHQAEVVQVPAQEDVRLQWRLPRAGSELEGSGGVENGEGRRVHLHVGRHM